jgi:magnesium transporter
MKVHRRTQPGTSPGQILPDPAQQPPTISVLACGGAGFSEQEVASIEAAHALVGRNDLVWINVEGLGDAATIERAGMLFGLHRLALEDTVNVHQRAKVEERREPGSHVDRLQERRHRVHRRDQSAARNTVRQCGVARFGGGLFRFAVHAGQYGLD